MRLLPAFVAQAISLCNVYNSNCAHVMWRAEVFRSSVPHHEMSLQLFPDVYDYFLLWEDIMAISNYGQTSIYLYLFWFPFIHSSHFHFIAQYLTHVTYVRNRDQCPYGSVLSGVAFQLGNGFCSCSIMYQLAYWDIPLPNYWWHNWPVYLHLLYNCSGRREAIAFGAKVNPFLRVSPYSVCGYVSWIYFVFRVGYKVADEILTDRINDN